MNEREIIVCLGKSGSGKTTQLNVELRRRIRELYAAKKQSLVLIHDERTVTPQGIDNGAIGALAPKHGIFRTVSDAKKSISNGRWKSAINTIYQDEPSKLFDIAWQRANLKKPLPTLVVIDELDRLPHNLTNDDTAYRCVHHGRVYPIDVFGSSRMPQRCNPLWIAEATKLCLFQLQSHVVLDRIKKLGLLERSQVDRLPTLNPYQFLQVTP